VLSQENMKTHLECLPCTVNSYLRLADTGVIPEEKQEELMRQLLSFLSEADYNYSPPEMGAELHRMIRKSLQNPDPYLNVKKEYNQMMLDLYPSFKKMVEDSDKPFDTAMRLAIGGNVIDFGAKYQFDVMETIHNAMEGDLAIDDSRKLEQALENAQSVLYIGDNCGEIVLDKIFLEFLDVPEKIFVVRGAPVINDNTLDDAAMVGMEKVARVVTTGDDSPGAVWERSSEEFRSLFTEADVVISKGQGNLEGLIEQKHKNLYYLLVTKCELIADRIASRKGAFVVKKT
jgi:damage-control phosphatase, subfamily I